LATFFKGIAENIPNIVDLAFGLGTTVWIYYLIKIPWGLYFKARKGRIDGQESKERNIQQDEDSIAKLYSIEKKLLVTSLSAHVFSALGVWAISYLTGGKYIRPHVSLLFLGSAVLRPAWEIHFHIRARIEQLVKRIQYPVAYIEKLLQDVLNLERRSTQHENNIKSLREQHEQDRNQLQLKEESDIKTLSNIHSADIKRLTDKGNEDVRHLQGQIAVLKNRLVEQEDNLKKTNETVLIYFEKLEVQFNEALTSVSADKKMIEGVSAFLKLVRDNLIK